MNIETMKVADLMPYLRNAKKHDKKQIDNVAESIKQFGMVQPVVVDKDNNIIIGHCRTEACKKLKIEEIPVVKLEDLTPEEANKLRLLDNKLNESEWDFELLAEDIPTLDFDGFDIDWELPEIQEQKEIIEDEVPEVPKEPNAKLGDVYQLGDHTLICGDSTNVDTINKLIGNNKLDMVFTDPPYNMGYSGVGIIRETTKNVRERIKNIIDFDAKSISYLATMDVGSIYIFTSKDLIPTYFEIFKDWKFNILTWVKQNNPPMCNNNFLPDIEYLLYFHKGKRVWNNGLRPIDIYRRAYFSTRQEGHAEAGDVHPTMKPIKLISDKLQISSNEGGYILDMFGGSGSTLIAAEQLGRKCLMCELDPGYVDVIIQRWENLTGKKAVLVNE